MNASRIKINFYYFKTLQVKKLYFAYGSNLDINRLERRIGKVVTMGKHRIYSWRLVFNAGHGNSAFANIQMTGNPSDFVEGVVYEVTLRQLKKLDNFEGAPDLYTRVIHYYGKKDLHMYVALNPAYTQQENNRITPSKEYLDFMLKGSAAFKLAETSWKCGLLYDKATDLKAFS